MRPPQPPVSCRRGRGRVGAVAVISSKRWTDDKFERPTAPQRGANALLGACGGLVSGDVGGAAQRHEWSGLLLLWRRAAHRQLVLGGQRGDGRRRRRQPRPHLHQERRSRRVVARAEQRHAPDVGRVQAARRDPPLPRRGGAATATATAAAARAALRALRRAALLHGGAVAVTGAGASADAGHGHGRGHGRCRRHHRRRHRGRACRRGCRHARGRCVRGLARSAGRGRRGRRLGGRTRSGRCERGGRGAHPPRPLRQRRSRQV